MTLLPTIPTYTPPAAPTTTTASYYPGYPTTPAYPTMPSYGHDQYQGSIAAVASQVYDLQRVITAAGTAAYGNRNYQAAVTELQQRLGQMQTNMAGYYNGGYTQQAATINDLANRLVHLRAIVFTQPSYYQPTYPTTPAYPTYPTTPTYTQPPTYYPQPGYGQQPGYGMHRQHNLQRRLERLKWREQQLQWRQQQLMQQQQNPLAQIIGAFSGLANGGIR